jgi:hypothetical protein
MDTNFDSTDRSIGDYVLFAVGFLGFLTAAGAVILAVKSLAVLGFVLLLLSVLTFGIG